MQPGSIVTIAAPFNAAFPDEYAVVHVFADGSAAVVVPGWVQQGTAFDPAQGANFAAAFLIDAGRSVDLSTIDIPTSIPPAPVAPASMQIVSASTPELNGAYAIDLVTQQNVGAVSIYTAINNRFPASQAALPWPDVSGTYHMFPSVALWQAFATAMADFVMQVNLGHTPAQPVQI